MGQQTKRQSAWRGSVSSSALLASHAFGAVVPGSAFAFAGGAPFSVAGIAIARNAAVVEAGLDIGIAPGATLGIAYNGQLARSAQDHAIKGNLAVRF